MSHLPGGTRLVSSGDVSFNDRVGSIPAAIPEAVCAALAYLREADICFMNCETPLTRRNSPIEKTVCVRSDPIVAKELADLGIHVVTLANNHMMDYGYGGLTDTLEVIESAGIAHVGAGLNLADALRPHVRSINGIRIAFLGVATTLTPASAAGPERPGIAPIRVGFSFEVDPNLMSEQPGTAPIVRTQAVPDDVDRVAAVISQAKNDADYVVVAIHWGVTRRRVTAYQGMIAEYQPPLGHALIDAGADLILGNHSHNLHGVEVYRGRPIFYSLGNYIYQYLKSYMEPESVIVLADFEQSGLRIELVPVLLNAGGFPEIPNDVTRRQIIELLRERSAQFGTRFTDTADGVLVQLDSLNG